jgi:hypothetical protein
MTHIRIRVRDTDKFTVEKTVSPFCCVTMHGFGWWVWVDELQKTHEGLDRKFRVILQKNPTEKNRRGNVIDINQKKSDWSGF